VKYILYGTVAALDAAGTIVQDGAVYIDGRQIAAVQPRNAAPPAGFDAGATALETRGTIYPGLIELHNHPPYNVMPTWEVDQRYNDRETWRASPLYNQVLKTPMKILQASAELLPAIVRFVESKSLVAGVTATQGISITGGGTSRYYVGLIRVVEQTLRAELPDAVSQVNDVAAGSVDAFYAQLQKATSFILHLSEGDDDAARQHFLAMHRSNGDWALTNAFAGIHCVGLADADFQVLAQFGASMIWSPLSNLLLYGQTTNLRAALAAGLTIGMGADWSFTGSKSAFGELKCMRVVNGLLNLGLSDRDIVSTATRNAAKILKWDHALGSLETGKLADLLVLDGQSPDPYLQMLSAGEERISLVFVDGEPAFGTAPFMQQLGATGEAVRIGTSDRVIASRDADLDPAVSAIGLGRARTMLQDALHHLPELQQQAEHAPARSLFSTAPQWRLLLPELDDVGSDQRLRLTAATVPQPPAPPAAVGSIELDALTVADDPAYFDALSRQRNLPGGLVDGLKALFR
jgi:cytosine/adenosine deaminase-related metal-dependent hydrolase